MRTKSIKNISYFIVVTFIGISVQAQKSKLNNRRTFESLTPTAKRQSALPEVQKSLFEQSQTGEIQYSDPMLLKPTRSSEILRSENEDYNKLAKILEQQIAELNKLIQKTKNPRSKSELWLRLAELYVEKADLAKTLIDQKYDRDMKVHKQNPKSKPPLLDYKSAQVHNRRAVTIYEKFLEESPKDPRVDQALFFLGYNYFELDDSKKGLSFYQRLAKDFPKSSYIVESRFALGEYYFENNEFAKALEHYRFVTKSNNKRLGSFSNYKIAWCQFKLGDYKPAIIALEKLIQAPKNRDKTAIDLRLDGEARRDIILFYIEGGNAERAIDYFNSLFGASDGFSQIEKLAYVYSDRGDRSSARTLFSYLIKQRPYHPKSFDYQYQIVKSYSTAKDIQIFREEMYRWIKDFGPNSQWSVQNSKNTELVEKSTKLLEQTLRTWVLQQHQTAQNSRGKFSQTNALEGYKIYFSEFPNSSWTGDLRFFHGELLYDMNRFDEASREYRWVLENANQSKYRSAAAANLLIAVEKSLPADAEIAKKIGDKLDEQPLDKSVENYITQATWYLKNFPKDKKSGEIQFRIGRLYYQYNHFNKAIPYFKSVVKDYPDTKEAEYSANLLLDIFNLKKDYEGLTKYSQELLAIPSIARGNVGKEIRDLLQQANFKKAQDLEAKNDFFNSAEQYELFSKQNPNSSLASMGFFNAAINFNKAGNVNRSVGALEALNKRNDAKAIELRKKTAGMLPDLYRNSGRLGLAAGAYLAAAKQVDQKQDKANFYYNAAILYEVLEQKEKAIESYLEFYNLSTSKDKAQVLFNLAELHRSKNQRTRSIEYYERYLNESRGNPEKNIESAYWLYVLNKNRQQDKDKWSQTVTRLYNQAAPEVKKVTARFPAQIELDNVKQLYSSLWSIRLDDLKTLKSRSDRKIAALENINQKISNIIKFDSPEEILDAVKIFADSNLNIYESLMNAPMPLELKSPEDIQKYREGVKKISDPFMNKALEAYELVVQRASEFETYNESLKLARIQISKIKPEAANLDKGQLGIEQSEPDWMGL